MARRKKNEYVGLPLTTEIEVVAMRGKEVNKKIMQYGEALKLKPKGGWIYKFYQIGFCSIPEYKIITKK